MLGLVHAGGGGPAQDLSDQVVFKEALPGRVRGLGEHEEEGEEVGQPEVVGGDGGVLLGVQLALVHKAACGPALQLRPDIGRAVDPAVGPENEELIILFSVASDLACSYLNPALSRSLF